jgi:putative membrane protein
MRLVSLVTRFMSLVILLGAISYAQTLPTSKPASQTSQATTPAMSQTTAKPAMSSTLTAADKKFMNDAAVANLAEVALGQLAVQQGSSDEVKQLGQRMVDDHGKANQQLQAIATQKGVALPTQLTPGRQATKDKLASLSGKAFDQAYMNLMLKNHHGDIAKFRRENLISVDPQVKAFAKTTLPTLQDHLKQITQVIAKWQHPAETTAASATN